MGWAVVLLVAASGMGQAHSYQVDGYACGDLTNAGREGTHLVLTAGTRLMHTGGNSSLYASTFTMEMFAKITPAPQAGSEVTLIGNMDTAGGQTTGWKVSCIDSVCCLKAYLKQIPQTMQSVCTHNNMGSPIVPGKWFQIAARYEGTGTDVNGPTGKAAIFVNGIKHNAVDWGNPGRGAINYAMPSAPFAIGDTASDLKMDEVRLWSIALTDSQILDTSYETAWRTRADDQSQSCSVVDSPYDLQKYTRIASVLDLSPLVLYIKDPEAATVSNQNIRGQPWINATSTANIFSSSETGYIDKDPLLELLPTSRGVLADVYPRLDENFYNSLVPDQVTVVISQAELTVLEMRVRDPNYDDVVTVRNELRFQDNMMLDKCLQHGIGTKNMQDCSTEYNDRGGDLAGWHSFAGVEGYEGMHTDGSAKDNSIYRLELVGQKLDVDNLLRENTVERDTETDPRTLCRGTNTAFEEMQLAKYLPDNSDVQSRLHVRLVWSHRGDYDWWMPEQGFEYVMDVRSYGRYHRTLNHYGSSQTDADCPDVPDRSGTAVGNNQKQAMGKCTKLKLGLHAHFSPEFINSESYPKPAQERQEQTDSESFKYASSDDSLKAVKNGDSLAVAIGEELSFLIRVQDRNLGDINVIRAREDPGLPPGHVITTVPGKTELAYTAGMPSYPTRSELTFPASYATSKLFEDHNAGVVCPNPAKCSNCKANYLNSVGDDLSPPGYVDRLFTYKPRELHAGGVFRVCLFVETTNVPAMGLTRYDATARVSSDLCVRIKVLMPTPHLLLPRGDREFEAIVGCQLKIPLRLHDSGALGYDAAGGVQPTQYKYQIVSTPDGSKACSSSICGPIGSSIHNNSTNSSRELVEGASFGLPRGMKITQIENVLVGGEATLTWTPERDQAYAEGYTICVRGHVEKILPQYSDLRMTPATAECFVVRVRKCQECVRTGQSLASIARSLKADLLSLQMSNPFLDRPEHILPGTVLSTGPLYQVREGDFLESLSNRFLVSVDDLKLSNPDVALGDGALTPGMQICVRVPVCDITCKYGTNCRLPADSSR